MGRSTAEARSSADVSQDVASRLSGQSITRAVEIVTSTRNNTFPSVEGRTSIDPDPSSFKCSVALSVATGRWTTSKLSAGIQGEDQI